MKFTSTPLIDAYLIDVQAHADSRGFFARTVCIEEFGRHNLNSNFVQQSISWNPQRGTLRGLHYQVAPYEEDKLVRVTHGAVYDVIVDVRTDSATYGQWYGVELSAENHRQLYIPKGFAHGFQTLLDATEVYYQMTTPYHPDGPRGIRFNDKMLNIDWPLPVDVSDETKISRADAQLPVWPPV